MLSEEFADAVRLEFYKLLNAHRIEHGLRPLEVNFALQDYADIRVYEQGIRRGHIRSDGSAAGSGWYNSRNHINSQFAENIGGRRSLDPDPQVTAFRFFSSWRNSYGHNRHMLWDFDTHITMAFGIIPEVVSQTDQGTRVASAGIFATGYSSDATN